MKKKIKTKKSEYKMTPALVFDRFYGIGASAARVVVQRILIAAAITFFAVSYVFSMYEMPVNKTVMPFVASGFAAVFSLLFSVVKRRIAIPVLTVISGIVISADFDSFWRKFSYFIDAVILECNGRLFDTTGSTVHTLKAIQINGRYTVPYTEGVVFGGMILCVFFALITAAGVMGKPHVLPSLSVLLLLCTPKLASERLFFGWQLIPLVALYAGMIAIGTYYRDGLAIRHVYAAGGYRRKVALDDRRFNAAVKSQNAGQRIVSRGLHYSKYFSSVMSAVAMFTALGIILSVVFADSAGIDYESFYAKLQSLGSGKSTSSSPFKVGSEADYFVSRSDSVFKANNRLRLTSPSMGTKEIIRVTKPISSKPVYLRGDIGIDFDGTSWSSPVTDEPQEWLDSGLYSYMLPIEVIAIAAELSYSVVESINYNDEYQIGAYLDIDVEYLCDTDVIFAPAYDYDLTMFDPMYRIGDDDAAGVNIYGDFSFRRRKDTAAGETLSYVAAVPYYTDAVDDYDISYFSMMCDAYNLFMVFDGTYDYELMNNMLADANLEYTGGYQQCDYGEYIKYVKNQYLGVPDKMKADIDEFIESSGLDEERDRLKEEYFDILYRASTITTTIEYADGHIEENVDYVPLDRPTNELADRLLSAVAVSEYLKSNYTYSLDARVDKRDPVMSFLNNTKSGHCALYASAMTLILREWGIPARYCTGFAANADLSMVTLRSKDLHAWVEVYMDGLGWVTFDPTAAAVFGGQGGSETSNASSNAASSSQAQSSSASSSRESSAVSQSSVSNSSQSGSSSRTPDTHDSGMSSTSVQTITFAQILPYILIILAICAAAALIVLAVMAYVKLKQRAYKQLQSFRRDKNSNYVYEKLLAVLRFCKLEPMNGEQPHEFFERAEQTLECEICDNYGLFERLAFGATELDETDRAQLGRSMDKVYRAAESRFWFIGKIRLRLLVLSKKV